MEGGTYDGFGSDEGESVLTVDGCGPKLPWGFEALVVPELRTQAIPPNT